MTNNIIFLCDGNKEECLEHGGCYKNGGDCEHTSCIEHAKNFKSEEYLNAEIINYVEENFLSEEEKIFLIACIFMAREEGFYIFKREKFKNINFDEGKLRELLLKLGGDEDEIKEILSL